MKNEKSRFLSLSLFLSHCPFESPPGVWVIGNEHKSSLFPFIAPPHCLACSCRPTKCYMPCVEAVIHPYSTVPRSAYIFSVMRCTVHNALLPSKTYLHTVPHLHLRWRRRIDQERESVTCILYISLMQGVVVRTTSYSKLS